MQDLSQQHLDEQHGGILFKDQAKGPFSINSSGLVPSNVIEEEVDYDGFVDRAAQKKQGQRPQSQENTSKGYFVWLNNILGKQREDSQQGGQSDLLSKRGRD